MSRADSPLLEESFYRRDAVTVAQDLIGAELWRGRVGLRITEVEAYVWPKDSASHARMGPTARNAVMFGPPGRAYVYLCYGIHQMLNVVTNPEGEASAVLIRSCEPITGLAIIGRRRGGRVGPDLVAGPGKVGAALALDPSWSGHPLWSRGGLELRRGSIRPRLLTGRRVGIDYALPADRRALRRFALAECRAVTHRVGLRPL